MIMMKRRADRSQLYLQARAAPVVQAVLELPPCVFVAFGRSEEVPKKGGSRDWRYEGWEKGGE